MNAPSLRGEKEDLERLRDEAVSAGRVRVVLAEADGSGYDRPVPGLDFKSDESDVAEVARAIIEKRMELIDSVLEQNTMENSPLTELIAPVEELKRRFGQLPQHAPRARFISCAIRAMEFAVRLDKPEHEIRGLFETQLDMMRQCLDEWAEADGL